LSYVKGLFYLSAGIGVVGGLLTVKSNLDMNKSRELYLQAQVKESDEPEANAEDVAVLEDEWYRLEHNSTLYKLSAKECFKCSLVLLGSGVAWWSIYKFHGFL
jgi:hypothetical protein